MKATFKKIMALFIVTSSLFISGCQKDLYDPENAASKNGLLTGVPSDFNWSTLTSVNLTVNVDDQYNGEYYYVIEVYDNNPLYSSNAKLLGKGVAKKDQSFTSSITVPQGTTTLYVCQTNPIGNKEVKTVTVSSENLTCDFAGSSASTKSSAVSTRSIATKSDSYVYQTYTSADIPASATLLDTKTAKKYTLSTGNTYVIDGYSGDLTFPGEGNLTVFVKGTWTSSSNYTTLQKGTKIIVLDGGEFISQSSNQTISGVSDAKIIVMTGGKFNASNKDINISSTDYGEITNQGIFNAPNLSLTRNAVLHNNGTMGITNSLSFTDLTNSVTNDKTLIVAQMTLKNGTIINKDIMTVTGKISGNGITMQNSGSLTADIIDVLGSTKITNNCKIILNNYLKAYDSNLYLGKETLLQSKNLEAGRVNVESTESSIFDITNEAVFKGSATFKGVSSNFALVKMVKVNINYSYNQVHYTGNIKIESDSHTANSVNASDYYIIDNGASLSKTGESGLYIAATDCTGSGNTSNSGTPSNPSFPIAVEPDNNYTFAMEDSWPNYGDYDMNDVVTTIRTSYLKNSSNKATQMTINVTLRAIGAIKTIGAALQLDNVQANNIQQVTNTGTNLDGSIFERNSVGIEDGQSKAVIPLFDNAHKFLKSSGITNTIIGKNNVSDQTAQITISFKNPISVEDADIKSLNFFIVTDGKKDSRTEVHLAGYDPTDKFNKSLFGTGDDNSVSGTKFTSNDNLIWGILIPTEFSYPVEYEKITNAYPDFGTWAKSSGSSNQNWYNSPKSGATY